MKFLLIEEDVPVARVFAQSMDTRGHRVTVAADATDGRARLENEAFDAIVVDLGLGSDGTLPFLEWARKAHPRMPRILTSGVGPPSAYVIEPSREAFLRKPYSIRELLALLRRMESPP